LHLEQRIEPAGFSTPLGLRSKDSAIAMTNLPLLRIHSVLLQQLTFQQYLMKPASSKPLIVWRKDIYPQVMARLKSQMACRPRGTMPNGRRMLRGD
jgi:hypothetical protein